MREKYAALSDREWQIALRIADRRMHKQIAHEFGVSEATIKVHARHIMEKLGHGGHRANLLAACMLRDYLELEHGDTEPNLSLLRSAT